ncbi:MAG: PEP-CTERM sorting domain-containing protein [Bryobacteraceae bacterium]
MHRFAIGLALISSAAFAGSFTIDDFSVNQGPITSATAPNTVSSGVLAIGGGVTRELTLNTLTLVAPPEFTVQVTAGILDVTNGSGDDSQVVVTYVIPALPIPAGASNVAFFLEIVQSDGNPTQVALGGTAGATGNFNIPPNTNMQVVPFPVAGVSFGPGTLTLTFDGADGWDLSADSLGVQWTDRTNVPEPGSALLLGLGLVTAAFLRRRRA